MPKHMNRYFYNGPVMEFHNCVQRDWLGETFAVSEKKARSNLIYQWKKKHNRCVNSKISLPGELIIAD